jgi:hypothetical protein
MPMWRSRRTRRVSWQSPARRFALGVAFGRVVWGVAGWPGAAGTGVAGAGTPVRSARDPRSAAKGCAATCGCGRVIVVPVKRGASRYEGLQVLLTVPLGFVHIAFFVLAFYLIVTLGPLIALVVIAVGALEIVAGRTMAVGPGVLSHSLIGAGAVTIAFSGACLVFMLSMMQ